MSLNDRSIEHRIVDYLVDVLGNPKEIETGPLIALVSDAIGDASEEKRLEFLNRLESEAVSHVHEALHATYMAADVVDRHVVNAKAVVVDPALKEIADRASEALGELYQAIGAKL
jgi:hypothetical protein